MQRNNQNLKKYRKTCDRIVERSDNKCEVMIDGKRCARYINPVKWINFAHKDSRNGKSDEWILDPESIGLSCSRHHIDEHTKGGELEFCTYEENEINYIPDEQEYPNITRR